MIRTALLAVLVTACAADTSTGITAEEVTCPTGSTLTYANFGSAFLSDNCLSCHASKERPTLTTQAAALANRSAIITAAVTNAQMPESGSLAIEERRLLGEWLACGAP